MELFWKKTCLHANKTIKNALEILNKEALQIVLIIDETYLLLGVVTDGDIRRSLLRNMKLSDSITKVMNKNPITALQGTKKEMLLDIMDEKKILSVPLVDPKGRVTGLETLHNALEKKKFQNPVFIMAGGFGTRLKPLTDNCPKPMLKVGDKPILETTLRNFIKSGFSNFYISTHFMPDLIKQHFGNGQELGVNISYIHEKEPLGTGGALGLLPNDLPKHLPLIMINGDVLTKINYKLLLEFHVENGADATICVQGYDYQVPFGVVNGKNNRITTMVEKPVHRYFVNAGIYVISSQVINTVKKNEKIDMPTLLEQRMKGGQKVLMFPMHEYWLDIGRMDDFNRAQLDIHSLEL